MQWRAVTFQDTFFLTLLFKHNTIWITYEHRLNWDGWNFLLRWQSCRIGSSNCIHDSYCWFIYIVIALHCIELEERWQFACPFRVSCFRHYKTELALKLPVTVFESFDQGMYEKERQGQHTELGVQAGVFHTSTFITIMGYFKSDKAVWNNNTEDQLINIVQERPVYMPVGSWPLWILSV